MYANRIKKGNTYAKNGGLTAIRFMMQMVRELCSLFVDEINHSRRECLLLWTRMLYENGGFKCS